MKSFLKVLILLGLVGAVVFSVWKLLGNTLLEDEEIPVSDTAIPPVSVISTPAPKAISEEEAFAATVEEENVESKLNCQEVYALVEELYAVRGKNSSLEQGLSVINANSSLSEKDIVSFEQFAKTLWTTPLENIKPLDQIKQTISDLCAKTH